MKKNRAINLNRALTVGEVAKRSGVTVATVHFYESKGLIKSSRNQGNQRRFPAVVLRYIAIIKVAQSTGIPLKEIQEILSQFPPNSKLTAEQWRIISLHWRDSLEQRITKLTRLRDNLDGCIGCGCLSLTECPLRNPNDILGETGSGPIILLQKEK
ncbi:MULTISPECIES: redox-sensitive transcriptional activator SoxR [Xenorhabdus]|uniref:redox-sensitive transcriptional activator SoxR n=1 Tax=Xenorhabdus TaxID=626 RepID=UPI000C03FDFF|nr:MULTISPECIES: redox-sensitive transcriptional activator SoxR [Xenorhabdus]